ncbi:TLD-domain-containing protein, partial [Rhizophagus diaphanus]
RNVIQVWEHVLKWGIAQNSELSSDLSSYSKDDFNILKNTLQQFIPFINFFNLTSKEYLDKVYPYKKVIPKDLRENLFKYFMDRRNNNSEPKIITKETSSISIDSKIITIQHAELISKWIDRLEITDEMKNSYEFKLILRESRDGFSPSKFHETCDNQSHTITIIKVKDSNEILGGYNPIVWKSDDGFGTTKDSFIFSFKNKENIENYILSRVKDEKYAIENSSSLRPSFGDGDLYLYGENYNQGCCYYSGNYDKSIRETDDTFSIEEYEIFQIIKDD